MGFAPAGALELVAGLALLAGVGLWLEMLRRLGGIFLPDKETMQFEHR
jgi:hypothetical protein